MYKNRILVLFLVLISILSYSCVAKKITRPTPKETDKKLSITIDYYGGGITTAPDDAVTVEIYKTKDSANDVNIRAFKKYTLKDFIDSTKPVIIPLNYEVVIKLSKRDDGDSTDISGDVPNDGTFQSDTEELQFTIKDHKSFIITFSNTPIEKVAVNFKALENGYIDVVVKKDDKITNLNYKVDADSEREIEFIKSWFSDYTIEATAIGDKDYDFKGWSGGATGEDNPLEIVDTMDGKTITANFLETPITINFEAGANGSVYVDFTNIDDSVVTNKLVAIASGTGSITISKSLLETQKIEARAVADTDYDFKGWSGGASGNNNPLEIVDTMDGQTITASFRSTRIITFTFTAGAAGAIDVYVLEDGTDISNKRVSANNIAGTIELAEYLFTAPYRVEARPVADTDYDFKGWSGGATGNNNPLEIVDTMDGQTITASFIGNKFTFTAGANGTIKVYRRAKIAGTDELLRTIPTDINSITINISEFDTYNFRAVATEDAGYTFINWSDNSTTTPLYLTKDMERNITATFGIGFSIKATPGGYIDVEIRKKADNHLESNDIVNYRATKTIKFVQSLFDTHKVLLKPTATTDMEFTKWIIRGGADISTLSTLEIKADSEKNIDAVFTSTLPPPVYGAGALPPLVGGWYEIRTKENLLYVANQVNSGTGSWATYKYRIMNNIDYGNTYHKPIGLNGKEFKGVINGNNFRILNAKFDTVIEGSDSYTGFLGYLRDDYGAAGTGIISNLIIDKTCTINSSAQFVAAIVASITSTGKIYDCVNEANINTYGSSYTGGIANGNTYNNGRTMIISNVYNSGNITANYGNVGGIAGNLVGDILLVNVYNTGNITYTKNNSSPNAYYVGGILGNYTTFGYKVYSTNVYSTGNITSTGDIKYVGGVFGSIVATAILNFKNIYFTGNAHLPVSGFGSESLTLSDPNVVRAANLSGLETTFNSIPGMTGIWKAGALGRPVIDGLGEGK